MLREGVIVLLNAVVGGLHISGLKRRLANNQCVNDHAQRPDVNFVAVSAFSFQHLGSDVVGRAANCSLPFSIEVDLGCEAEITDLDLHLVVDEEVAEFEVTVDDSVRVQVLER